MVKRRYLCGFFGDCLNLLRARSDFISRGCFILAAIIRERHSGMKVSAFQSRSFLLLLFGASIASGVAACWHRAAPTSRYAPRPARRTEQSVQVSTAAAVQSLLAYRDARSACSRGQYQQAAEILAHLALSRTLNEDRRAFARAQQQICLNHLIAGNPPHPEGTRNRSLEGDDRTSAKAPL
jgi:hypothetical protein